jgi:hypothetical protein
VAASVTTALDQQTGLALQLTTPSVSVYTNANYSGIFRQVNPSSGVPVPVFSDFSASGPLTPHWTKVQAGLAPASAFALDVGGQPTGRKVESGWSPTFTVPSTTTKWSGHISLHQFPLNGLLALFTLGMWLIIWLGFGWIHRLEWLFTGRRRLPEELS